MSSLGPLTRRSAGCDTCSPTRKLLTPADRASSHAAASSRGRTAHRSVHQVTSSQRGKTQDGGDAQLAAARWPRPPRVGSGIRAGPREWSPNRRTSRAHARSGQRPVRRRHRSRTPTWRWGRSRSCGVTRAGWPRSRSRRTPTVPAARRSSVPSRSHHVGVLQHDPRAVPAPGHTVGNPPRPRSAKGA